MQALQRMTARDSHDGLVKWGIKKDCLSTLFQQFDERSLDALFDARIHASKRGL